MSAFIKGFVLGSIVGAGVALFMAPQSGEETRAQLKDKGLHYKDVAEEGALVARERGIEAIEKGKETANEALQKSKEAANEALQKSKETANEALQKSKEAANEALQKSKEAANEALQKGKDNVSQILGSPKAAENGLS